MIGRLFSSKNFSSLPSHSSIINIYFDIKDFRLMYNQGRILYFPLEISYQLDNQKQKDNNISCSYGRMLCFSQATDRKTK